MKIDSKPVKLINNGTNICWWNSFVQLFPSTRNMMIINYMFQFINHHQNSNHKNNNNINDNNNDNNSNKLKQCWYCNILQDFITIMTNSNDAIIIDFNKYLPKSIIVDSLLFASF